jgi:uncharacterized membrane protein HdeD (DUF308 family)
MFAQVVSALLGVFLLYIGFIDSSVISILLGISMLLSSADMLYAAKQARLFKWVLVSGLQSVKRKLINDRVQHC